MGFFVFWFMYQDGINKIFIKTPLFQIKVALTASSKPAGRRLNEPPPPEVWLSPFEAENILFLFCEKNAQKETPQQ